MRTRPRLRLPLLDRTGDAARLTLRMHPSDARAERARRRHDDGFGMIEVMVAMIILLVVTIPMAYLMTSVTQQSATARSRITAVGIAEHWLEYYNNLALDNGSFPNPGGVVNTTTSTINSTTYTATISMQWGQTGVNGNLCNVGSVPQIIDILAAVTWGQGNSVQESTVANPPYGLISPTTGFLAVQVDNAAGAGQAYTPPSQPIDVSFNPAITGAPTTVPEGGCIFVEASTGTYQVTLSSPTTSPFSYVDDGENTTTNVGVTVPAEATGFGSVAYDQGGAINVGYASQTSLADGVTCPLSGVCFTFGREGAGALVLEDSNGTWSNLTLPNGLVSGVTSVGCLSSTQCVLSGFGPSGGVLLGVNPTSGSVAQITLPTGISASNLTSVTCPASGTSCVVTGTAGGTTGVLLSTNGTTAVNALPATGTTTVVSLSGSSCSSATQCFAVGTGTSGASHVGVILAGSGTTWALQTSVPSTVTAISAISCATQAGASPFMCTASVNSAGTTVLSSTNGGSTWSLPTTIPSSGLVGPINCTGATSCFASLEEVSGSTTTGVVVSSTDGGATWSVPSGFPSGLGAITALSCTSTTQCIFSGSNSAGDLAGSLSGTTWTTGGLPGSGTFASGVACDTATHCVAAAESPTGPLAFVISNYSSTWSAATGTWTGATGTAPAGIGSLTGTGLNALGLPLTYQNVQYAGGTNVGVPYTTASAADPTVLGNLFPFAGATGATYSAWSGDCAANQPSTSWLASTLVLPGQYAPSGSTLTIPLSYLALRMVDSNGQPITGATVTATVTTAGCAAHVYALPSSQGDGMVEAGLPMASTGTPSHLHHPRHVGRQDGHRTDLRVGQQRAGHHVQRHVPLPDPRLGDAVMRLVPAVNRLALRIEQRDLGRPAGPARPTRVRGDDGMTLVELMISMVVLLVVMGMTATVMSTFYSNENQLSASYTAFQQVLPASTALQQYFRTMTQAAPTAATGVPVPAFTPTATTPASALQGPFNISPNSAVFTTDLGNPNGPSLITITTAANTAPAGHLHADRHPSDGKCRHLSRAPAPTSAPPPAHCARGGRPLGCSRSPT